MNRPALSKTSYPQRSCEIGIVHLGYGAFHRAHQAVYFDNLMDITGDTRWGIAAVNLRSVDSEPFSKASELRDGYLLKTIEPNGNHNFCLVRSHIKFVDAAIDVNAAHQLFALPSVTIVTITVTESGYFFNNNWRLNLNEPEIQAGLSGKKSETIYNFLAGALGFRAWRLNEPISILCCDNVRNNGRLLETAFLDYLEAKNLPDLLDWVRKNVSFPSSMVDRITPRSTLELKLQALKLFPEYSAAPIHSENFLQWVLEDNFASTSPDLSKVGVQIVSEVAPYEEAKIRILNGGHTGLAYLGALAGHLTFDQAMLDSNLRQHFDAWEENEVLPGLDAGIPFDTMDYLHKISKRFENKGISDQLERICMDGYSKMAIYIRPTLEACLRKGIFPKVGFDCVASWVIYARRFKSGNCKITYHEPFWKKLEPIISPGEELKLAMDSQLWGDLPERYSSFAPGLVDAIEQMEKKWPT